MRLLVLPVLLAVAACATKDPAVVACNSYLRSFAAQRAMWDALASPPTEKMNLAVSRLSRHFGEHRSPKELDFVWYENGDGQLGVCTIAGCPRGFFVYSRDRLDKEPIEARISATCGRGDF
jgi:hypothetical protein